MAVFLGICKCCVSHQTFSF